MNLGFFPYRTNKLCQEVDHFIHSALKSFETRPDIFNLLLKIISRIGSFKTA